jgi:hypothetical protein
MLGDVGRIRYLSRICWNLDQAVGNRSIRKSKMKNSTSLLVLLLCWLSIGCSSNPSAKETKAVKDDPAASAFFTEYQSAVNAISQKVLANDYAGAQALLASQKASLQGKCQAVRASGGDYPYQITLKTVTAKATLQDAIARATGTTDAENLDNNKSNEQRELMTEFNLICSS